MRRREFLGVLGGAAVLPLTARAQQPNGMRRIGLLMVHRESDPEFKNYLNAFRQGLESLGWIEERNIRIDTRWGALDDAQVREQSAKELLALQPDLILTQNTPPTASMLQQTHTVPIIFVIVADPVGSSFVASGNVTGFTVMEATTAGKWLELLKEMEPRLDRAAFLFNPATAPFAQYYLDPFKTAATSLGMEAMAAPVHDQSELESVIAAQVRGPRTGLIVMPDGFLNDLRAQLVSLKAYVKRNKNDAADAEAICEAVRRPTMRFVRIKTAEQQGQLMQHRTRDLLMRQRTQLINALRAHLAELGIAAAQGREGIKELLAIVAQDRLMLVRV